jgi:hypothetical protein
MLDGFCVRKDEEVFVFIGPPLPDMSFWKNLP